MEYGKKELERSLLMTWHWFRKSGVMMPEDGSWGVGERIMLTSGNAAMEHILTSFPAWTPRGEFYVIEQRRADCCMQSAFLFLLLHKLFGKKAPFRATAENLLFPDCGTGATSKEAMSSISTTIPGCSSLP